MAKFFAENTAFSGLGPPLFFSSPATTTLFNLCAKQVTWHLFTQTKHQYKDILRLATSQFQNIDSF